MDAAAVNQTANTLQDPIQIYPDRKINFTYSPTMANPEFSEAAFAAGDCVPNTTYTAGQECNFNVAFKPVCSWDSQGSH